MSEGRPIGGNQVVASTAQDAASETTAPIVAAGQQSITSRRADGTRRVRIEKRKTLIRHTLQMASLDFAVRIRRRNISYPQIIRHHHDYIGPVGGQNRQR